MNSTSIYDSDAPSKFVGTWSKLLKVRVGGRACRSLSWRALVQGFSPHQISPYETPDLFWSNLLLCDIDRDFLVNKLDDLDKDYCLGALKV
jgi:hypothetical protein